MSPIINHEEKKILSKFVSDNLRNAVHLYKLIRVTMTGNEVQDGWLKCVDPMTGTLILIALRVINDTFDVQEVVFIQNSCIISIDVITEVDPKIKEFLLNLYAPKEVAVDEDRRDRLVAFIKAHRMPAEISEDGRNISIKGCTIQPPYNDQSCMGSNPIVVFSVGNVIKIFDSRNKLAEEAKKDATNASAGDVNLESGMQNLKLAPAAEEEEKDFLSESSKSFSDENSESEISLDDLQNTTSNGESSATEESYEFVSKDFDK